MSIKGMTGMMANESVKYGILVSVLILVGISIRKINERNHFNSTTDRELQWHPKQVNYMGDIGIRAVVRVTEALFKPTDKSQGDLETITLEATLSSSGVIVKVDDVEIYKMVNKPFPWGAKTARLHAGVHLVVLHQRSGKLMRATNFLTWQPEIHKQLSQALLDIRRGRLVMLLGSPEFTQFLSEELQQQIKSLGSLYVEGFTLHDIWCWVGWKGGRAAHEALTTTKTNDRFDGRDVSPLHVHFEVPLSREDESCDWYSSKEMHERAVFCETYDGYGDFCSCQNPPWNPIPRSPPPYPIAESIPLGIVTARRLPHVLFQVGQIRNSPGGSRTSITIFVDGHNQEALDLGKALAIPVVEHNNSAPVGSTSRINEHVKFSLTQIFERNPEANLAIILEDDIDLAPDFIPYFHQIAPLLLSDSKLLFANAFNYNAYTHTAQDPSRLYRAHGIPGYGWMTTRSNAQEMLSNWTSRNQSGAVWDWWIRFRMLGTRDMIIPEVPRTRHMGGGGVHISGYDQILFSAQPINNVSYVNLDVDSVKPDVYEARLIENIAKAKVVYIVEHPCDVLPIPTNKTGDSYVIYINQPDERRESHSYYVVALCLGINERDPHESFNMMTTFPFYGNRVYLISCPNSPYCQPRNERVIYRANEDDANYARDNQFLKAPLKMTYALRIPPDDPQQEFHLQNRYVKNVKIE